MATPKFYVKASSYSNINPYPTWKRDADYWEKDLSNNLFYMAGNIGIGYPIPAGGLVVTTTIGIGTSAPQAALDVSGNVYLRDGTATAPILTFNTDTNTGFYRPGNDTLGFVTGGTERMRIDASGNTSFTGNVTTSANIGIGTLNPTTKLDIMGNLAIRSNSYNTNVIYFGNGIGANQSGLAIYALESAPTSAWMINAGYSGVQYNSICLNSGGGNVGIGTITPRAKLDILGSTLISGNIGIGTTNPQAKLHVNGTISTGNFGFKMWQLVTTLPSTVNTSESRAMPSGLTGLMIMGLYGVTTLALNGNTQRLVAGCPRDPNWYWDIWTLGDTIIVWTGPQMTVALGGTVSIIIIST